MIPGFSAMPMFMRKAGGVAASGRVKFTKDVFDANNYALPQIDIDVYTNSTGYSIEITVASFSDLYTSIGLPSPYGVAFSFQDGGNQAEYSYSSASLGSVTLVSPVFVPDIGYWHTSTSGVVGSFVPDVWYDFSINL